MAAKLQITLNLKKVREFIEPFDKPAAGAQKHLNDAA
jgi:hypothetical protein